MGASATHSVGAKLWNNTPKVIINITEQTAFKEELVILYNDEIQTYINISAYETTRICVHNLQFWNEYMYYS